MTSEEYQAEALKEAERLKNEAIKTATAGAVSLAAAGVASGGDLASAAGKAGSDAMDSALNSATQGSK